MLRRRQPSPNSKRLRGIYPPNRGLFWVDVYLVHGITYHPEQQQTSNNQWCWLFTNYSRSRCPLVLLQPLYAGSPHSYWLSSMKFERACPPRNLCLAVVTPVHPAAAHVSQHARTRVPEALATCSLSHRLSQSQQPPLRVPPRCKSF